MTSLAAQVLIVTADRSGAEATMRLLAKHYFACRTRVVTDGVTALTCLRTSPFSQLALVLLYLALDSSGMDVLTVLRSDPETRHLPVVMMTSHAEDPDLTMAYELGARSHLVKPFAFEAFVHAVAKAGLFWTLVTGQPWERQ